MRNKDDRTVHGLNADKDAEVVRYDRAGKWYLEPRDGSKRRALSVREAAHIAALGTAFFRRPGGMLFDARVRRERGL